MGAAEVMDSHNHKGKTLKILKRLIGLLLVALIAGSGFATPVVEEEISEITMLSGADYDTSPLIRYAVDKFHEDYPEVAVRYLSLDLSTGSSMTMQALNKADVPPNIYHDFIGRIAEFAVPGYALALDGVVRELDQFNDGVLDPYRKDGILHSIPQAAQANGMAINLNIMADIGYTVPDNWTIDDFLEMSELVKQFYGGEKWGTMMYAKNMSGDYMINTWAGSFGAEFFENGDYTRSTIRETGGEKWHEFFQTLMRNGYISPDSATLSDDDVFPLWGCGKYAAVPFFANWANGYREVGVSLGYGTFDVEFVEFPSATGDPVPAYSTTSGFMVVETGTAADAIAARLVEYMNDAGAQALNTEASGIPSNRKDSILESANPLHAQTGAIIAANGMQDVGLLSPLYSAIRAQHTPILRRLLNFELTPEESILLYERAVNEVLAY